MLNRIVEEVYRSIDNECYIAALTLALTIPDICGKAEFPEEKSTKKRYIYWYDRHVGYTEAVSNPFRPMPYASGEVVYSLRNSVLHQGTPNIEIKNIKEERNVVDKFTLTIADAYDGGGSHYSIGWDGKVRNRTLEINIVNLCIKLCRVAEGHYKTCPEAFDFFNYELIDKRLQE